MDWLERLIRRHIDRIFALGDVLRFIESMAASNDPRLNIQELLRSISGNYPALWHIITSLAMEYVPLDTNRGVEAMIKLQEFVQQSARPNPAFLIQKLRDFAGYDLCKQFTDENNQLSIIFFSPEFEANLINKLKVSSGQTELDLIPDHSLKLAAAIRRKFQEVVRNDDRTPILVCEENLRLSLYRLIQRFDPRIFVLSYTELSLDIRLISEGIVTGFPLESPTS